MITSHELIPHALEERLDLCIGPQAQMQPPSWPSMTGVHGCSGRVAAMTGRYLACVAGAILLVGCMADAGNHDQPIVPGYRYHDANHTNVPSGNASPQAIYNATHGTWLWPPAENDKPNG